MALTETGKGLRSFITGKPRTQTAYMNGKKRCKVCRFKIRGTKENHEAGLHHQGNRTGKVGR